MIRQAIVDLLNRTDPEILVVAIVFLAVIAMIIVVDIT